MSYTIYRGLADVTFIRGDQEIFVPGLTVLFEQTHTAVFRVYFSPDISERQGCTAVQVSLRDGGGAHGPVTYIPPSGAGLVFRTEDELGNPYKWNGAKPK